VTLLIRQIPLLALLLIVAVPAWGQEAKGVGVVTALTGQANLKRPQAPQAPLKLRDKLFVRDIVDTHKESLARVLLLGKSSVTVLELSRLEIQEETRPDGTQRAIIDLAAGKIRVMVARSLMKPGDEVQIRTPNAVAAVRGSDGVIEATTLPDGRPETSVLVASGVFEVSAPSTRPIAMAETWSDLPSGIRVVQAPALALGGGNPNVWIATGPPGLQQVVRRFASPSEINAAIQVFKIPGGVASGTQVGKREPNGEAVLATMEALTQVETLRLMKSQELIQEGKKNLGQVVSEDVSGKGSFNGIIGDKVRIIPDAGNGGKHGGGLGLGSSCAHGACSKGHK